MKNYIRINKKVIFFLTFFVFGISFYANSSYFFRDSPEKLRFFPPFIAGVNLNHNKHLGAEYYFIAESIAAGKGFGNPFQVETGPTAWMPPLYPYFLAFLILLLDSKLLVACVVVLLKNIVLILTGLMVYEIAKRSVQKVKPGIILILYAVWLCFFFRWFFQFTHDPWIVLLLIDVVFLQAVYLRKNMFTLYRAIVWGITGGIAMLCSSAVGFAWFTVCLVIAPQKKKFPYLALSMLMFFALVSLWLVRNYMVFDRFIFIKSNLYYDAYDTNYNTENGLIDENLLQHAIVWEVRKNIGSLYRESGEVAFLDRCRENFFTALSEDPYRFIRNVKNRFCALFLFYYPYNVDYERHTAGKSILHALPFLCIIIIILFKGYRASGYYFHTGLLIYAVYLLPYVLISYYGRYDVALIPFKVLFVTWGIDTCMRFLADYTNRSSEKKHNSSLPDVSHCFV